MRRARFADILQLLATNEVEFIVFGMTAGILQGAPISDLDCLGTIDDGKSYEDLLPETIAMSLAGGASIRVLRLAALIATKERAGRPKDVAALPVLRATLEERKKRT